MYVEDSMWGEPLAGDSLTLWRYMSIPAFLSILQRKALFFQSLQELAQGDPWEGHWSEHECPGLYGNLKNTLDIDWRKEISEHFKKSTFVNCWHQSEHESAAMWADSGRRRKGFRGEREKRSGVKANGIPG